jgi:hypothetical protein
MPEMPENIKNMWLEAAKEAKMITETGKKSCKPDILTNQGNYDMAKGPNGDMKPTCDPEEQKARALRAEKKKKT